VRLLKADTYLTCILHNWIRGKNNLFYLYLSCGALNSIAKHEFVFISSYTRANIEAINSKNRHSIDLVQVSPEIKITHFPMSTFVRRKGCRKSAFQSSQRSGQEYFGARNECQLGPAANYGPCIVRLPQVSG
jgi:hypothetical protein